MPLLSVKNIRHIKVSHHYEHYLLYLSELFLPFASIVAVWQIRSAPHSH